MDVKLNVPKIEIKQLLMGSYTIIDVRSPSEYQEFHIPGSTSLPLFSDEERAMVGTFYKQKSKEDAIQLGVTILSRKLPELYERIKELSRKTRNKPLVVYCWRGGMRSRTIVSIAGMLDIDTLQLSGGIRSYRQLISEELNEALHRNKKYIVLEGLTGTKKTEILEELELLGYPIINLEQLASHRGSIFGHIGLQPRSQKEFESLLYLRLGQIKEFPYYIIEAESKRVGRIVVPDFIMEGKELGVRIHIDMDIEKRSKTICDTYKLEENTEEFKDAILRLNKRLSKETFTEILRLLDIGDNQSVVELLLKEYYDPKYDYASQKYNTPVHSIYIQSLEDGINQVKDKINQIKNEFINF